MPPLNSWRYLGNWSLWFYRFYINYVSLLTASNTKKASSQGEGIKISLISQTLISKVCGVFSNRALLSSSGRQPKGNDNYFRSALWTPQVKGRFPMSSTGIFVKYFMTLQGSAITLWGLTPCVCPGTCVYVRQFHYAVLELTAMIVPYLPSAGITETRHHTWHCFLFS